MILLRRRLLLPLPVLALAAGCGRGEASPPPPAAAVELPAFVAPVAGGVSTPAVSARRPDERKEPAAGAAEPSRPAPDAPPPAPPASSRAEAPEADLGTPGWIRRAAADPERALRELRAAREEAKGDARAAALLDGLEAALLGVLGDDAEAYAALLALERKARPYAPVAVRNLCFTDGRDGGYGNPSRRAEGPFAPGGTLSVYCEVDPVCQRADGDGFSASIDVDLGIEDAGGKRVEEFDAWEKRFRLRESSLRSRRYVTDYYFHYKGLPVPRLPKGDYRFVVRFKDLADPERRTARAEIPLSIGGGD